MSKCASAENGHLSERSNPLPAGVPAVHRQDGKRLQPVDSAELRLRLARGLAAGLAPAEAGRRAGYLNGQSAWRAAQSDEVQAHVAKIREDAALVAGASLEWVLAHHVRIVEDADEKTNVRQASLTAITDVLGYKEEAARRREEAQGRFERMDDEALEDEMERLKASLTIVDGEVVEVADAGQ
ncbi:MAG: hypothetical protein F4X97_04005 [Boseongicola sp. SB0662_bin_57]|nr:hypothetical protein [Boseongicola sp. SB0662_bin_57]